MPPEPAPTPRERFRNLDRYRVEREWQRYSGTAQRELFRVLRGRFLRRHPGPHGWVADLGSGPGRFIDDLGNRSDPRVLLDLSVEALRGARELRGPLSRSPGIRHLVLGDAEIPPLKPGRSATVALLGNVLGFAEDRWTEVLGSSCGLVGADGFLLIEAVAGSGEHSNYLSRLPVGALVRALHSPLEWLVRRTVSEPFRRLPPRPKVTAASFRRIPVPDLVSELEARGFVVDETLSVAPGLGDDPERLEAIHSDPVAWDALIELEERLGRLPGRWENAAAYLVFARRSGTAPPVPRAAKPASAAGENTPSGRTGERRRRRWSKPHT